MQVFPCWRFLQATQLLALPGSEQPPRHWSWQHWPWRLHAPCLQLSKHTEETKKKTEKTILISDLVNMAFCLLWALTSITIKTFNYCSLMSFRKEWWTKGGYTTFANTQTLCKYTISDTGLLNIHRPGGRLAQFPKWISILASNGYDSTTIKNRLLLNSILQVCTDFVF